MIYNGRFYYRWVPESVRWLQSKNRMTEVVEILSRVAESNGKVLPSSVKDQLLASKTVLT